MKSILYNISTNKTEGRIIPDVYNGIYDSRLSTVQGELPEHIIQLTVIFTEPSFDSSLQTANYSWIVDTENLTYTQVWTYADKTAFQIAMEEWMHPQFAKRIIAPMQLVMEDVGSKMYNWFKINDFPIVKKDPLVHVYCNTILPEHQVVIDAFAGFITIEDVPVDENLIEPIQIEV